MSALSRDLRRALERAVREARAAAEAGARKVLESHAVGRREPWESMTPEGRALRNRLRAHGRQLGDRRDPRSGEQEIGRLVRECAYEHWHRMLFARFLAEASLLIEPETGVAVTLDEAKEFARERGGDWLALAGGWAGRMLPQIFHAGDPVLEIALPLETWAELEAFLEGLPREIFLADDSLGWVYQFWQADRKEAVNRSGVKIGADELPAVTQLFTEDYMVLFLLHNTLGAWWAGRVLAARPDLAASAKDEDELRAACAVGDVEWTYLRFVREKADDDAQGPWRPAAGAFAGWPAAAKDVTLLDPCMGSGHFLVAALPILAALRMAEEGLSLAAAVEAVLRDNLFGLEIDPRCTQIAAFNLAFAAWRMVGHRPLPALNLACSGLAVGASKAEWLRLAEKAASAADPDAARGLFGAEETLLTAGVEERVRNGLDALHDLFAKAPALGSLIDPRRVGGDIFVADFAALEPLLGAVLAAAESDDTAEMAVAAQGMAKAAEFLDSKFTLTMTNVPYLTRQAQSDPIRQHCECYYDIAKADLATSFIRRSLEWVVNGSVAVVAPTSWHYQPAYRRFRKHLLDACEWNFILRLGPGAFEGVSGEVVNVSLCTFTSSDWNNLTPNPGFWIDASGEGSPISKEAAARGRELHLLNQSVQKTHPDQRIILAYREDAPELSRFARSLTGTRTADNLQFLRSFWEFSSLGSCWDPLQSTVKFTVPFGGREQVIFWQQDGGRLRELSDLHIASIQGTGAWGKQGICVSLMGNLPVTLYSGEKYDMNCGVVLPNDERDLPALWAYLSSLDYSTEIRKIDKQLKLTTATLLKVPFNIEKWRAKAARGFSTDLPVPDSTDPTQWLFDGFPARSDAPLQVAVARLLGYRWPRQTGSSFMDCPALGPDGLEAHDDDDGIVCLPAVAGEAPAHERLAALLADAFGAEWSATTLAGLLAASGFAGKSLDDWLRDGFFAEHCKLFHNRPFVWHVWDGRRDGFHALVNYHRLAGPGGEGRRTLEKLIYSCLGEWVDRQRADSRAEAEGADARLAHAERLRAELVNILEGAPPYDVFVRWKPLHEQPVGWDPDIDDGARVNIRPFMTARPLGARAKGACILRAAPNVKWNKDRGKEPARERADYPWFWNRGENDTLDFAGGTDFDGNRWNDLHYTHAFKEAARARAGGGDGR